MAKSGESLSHGPERRAATRFPVFTPARVTFPGCKEASFATARLADLSTTGCYLVFDAAPPLPLDEELVIRLGAGLRAAGQVVRIEELSGKTGVAVSLWVPGSNGTREKPGGTRPGNPWFLSLEGLKQEAFQADLRLRRLRVIAYRYYRSSLKVEMAACATGLEPSYFSSFFSRTAGVSFSSWVQWVRLTKAINLLSTSNYSISEVAHLVGFHTLRSFERVFLQHAGITARQYKKLQVPMATLAARKSKA